ncbi:hypothetical protein DPV78_011158 [Talaromyces pinophilus]|nr:hypothetical protein DPV78_011158 [Talaromyces pinophilus]
MAPVKYLLVSAGLLASVMADYVAFSEWPASLVAGQPVTLKWVGGSDVPATITLRKGASTDLQDVQVLSTSATNGEFNWTPPADLQNADDYAFQITQGDEINYTSLLPLSGGSDAPNANANALDKTQSGAESASNSASAATETAASMTGVSDSAATAAATGSTGTETITSTGSSSSAEMNAESAAAAVTDTAASTGSTASDATGTTAGTTASEGSSATTSGPLSTETAKASKMNTPFVGSHIATPTATPSSSVQTDSAGRVGIPLALLAGAAGFLLLFV